MFIVILLFIIFILAGCSPREYFGGAAETFPDSVVLVWADYCGFCHNLRKTEWPKFLNDAAKSNITVIEIQADAPIPSDKQKLFDRIDARGYPTIVKFRNNEMYKYVGPRTSQDIMNWATSQYSF
jgi:thiol-disulfide isomerase/thioredoxin